MKKTILSVILISFFGAAIAQKSEIANAKNSYALFELGLQTKAKAKPQLEALEKAKVSADKAIAFEKTKNDPELWAYRSVIYSSIAVTDTVNKANAEAAFKTAQESIVKAKSLDDKNTYASTLENAERNLSVVMQNKGVAAFNKKDYPEAYKSFKYIADIDSKDSTFNQYTAYAASAAKMYDEAIVYYKKSIAVNDKNPNLYSELGRVYLTKTDTASALKVYEEGKAKYPSNLGLIFDELNIYLNRGEAAKQITKIESAIAADGKNKVLHYVAGIAYAANKETAKAEASYKKAIELDPNYQEANYNLGVLFIDKANVFITEANKLSTNKASEAKYTALRGKFMAELNNALPYLEKAEEINPKDKNTLVTLREVYVKLNKLDKASAIKKRIDTL